MLTPLDIETKEFKKSLGGYGKQDVDEFMHILLEDFKAVYLENISMKDKVSALTGAVARYKAMEDVMQNTLIVAQGTSEDIKRAASDKSKSILSEAEAKAASLILDARHKVSELELKAKQIEHEIDSYKMREAAALRSLLSILEKKEKPQKRTKQEKEEDDNGEAE